MHKFKNTPYKYAESLFQKIELSFYDLNKVNEECDHFADEENPSTLYTSHVPGPRKK
jgi:hypothetical protein